MSSELIIRYCSPTLAGLKMANLFSVRYIDRNCIKEEVACKNREFNEKGIYFYLLKAENGLALIYVFRKRMLLSVLEQKEIQSFLEEYGYDDFDLEACLLKLEVQMKNDTFPHEIGIFLGYPLADIKAFIKNKGANCNCVGCWKAYTDVESAKKIFAKYKKCTNVYCMRFQEGFSISRLTVAEK